MISLLAIPHATEADSADLTNLIDNNLTNTTAETTFSAESTITACRGMACHARTEAIAAEPMPGKTVNTVITVYTSTPDQTDNTPCITADGTDVCARGKEDVIASNWLPFGAKIKIPSLYGDRIFVVHDRMNRRYGYGRLDIWLNTSKAKAMKFGVKHVPVEVFLVKKDSELARR